MPTRFPVQPLGTCTAQLRTDIYQRTVVLKHHTISHNFHFPHKK